MTYRSLAALVAVAAALVCGVTDAAQQEHDPRSIRHKIADAYGVHSFHEVERVSFAFNVAVGERNIRRSWTWWPNQDRVRYDGGTWRDGEPFEYLKADLAADSTEEMVAVDQRFVNDTYWLVFPYHVEWDVSAEVTDEGMAPLPIGSGEARKVVVDYPDTGGYTPGDIYELYVGPDYRILQWVFRAGGSEEQRRPMSWEDEQRFGDITFATDHYSPDRSVRVWISDISVEFRRD
jgi:hypothetical protein